MDEHRTSTEMGKTGKYHIEVIELKNTITEVKNTLPGFNSRQDEAEEWISELKDRAIKLTQSENEKKKREKSLREEQHQTH